MQQMNRWAQLRDMLALGGVFSIAVCVEGYALYLFAIGERSRVLVWGECSMLLLVMLTVALMILWGLLVRDIATFRSALQRGKRKRRI